MSHSSVLLEISLCSAATSWQLFHGVCAMSCNRQSDFNRQSISVEKELKEKKAPTVSLGKTSANKTCRNTLYRGSF